ncbi:MAG: hypothetical protein H6838_07665 [Planctomycetes bacterium]|nr:hypothetical protein [Planctomycetota bacterium]MCB9885353.1 hypothetical protein [Planctomycetota bacterium]
MQTTVSGILSIALAAAFAAAQTQTPPSQDELLAAKLASPFLQRAPWHTDWDEALAAAGEQHRLLFGYFTTVNH